MQLSLVLGISQWSLQESSTASARRPASLCAGRKPCGPSIQWYPTICTSPWSRQAGFQDIFPLLICCLKELLLLIIGIEVVPSSVVQKVTKESDGTLTLHFENGNVLLNIITFCECCQIFIFCG